MQNIFSEGGLSLLPFLEISAVFVLTLIVFFDQKVYQKHPLLHHSFFAFLVLFCVLAFISETLATKIYAALMLVSVVVVEVIVRRKRRSKPAS